MSSQTMGICPTCRKSAVYTDSWRMCICGDIKRQVKDIADCERIRAEQDLNPRLGHVPSPSAEAFRKAMRLVKGLIKGKE